MKVDCLQENLLKALTDLCRIVPGSPMVPSTRCILLKTDGGRLRLSATDLEVELVKWVGAQIVEEGGIAIPAKTLRDVVRSLPAERIAITTEGRKMLLKCGSRSLELHGFAEDDFPPSPKVTEAATATVDAAALRQAIGDVIFCAAKDGTRPILSGIYLSLYDGTLTLVAADGFQLAEATIPAESTAEISTVISLAAFREIAQDAKTEGPVHLSVGEHYAKLAWQNTEVVGQVIRGTFPDYGSLFPLDGNARTTIVVEAEALLREIRAAHVFAKEGNNIIRLRTPDEQTLEIEAHAEEIGKHEGVIEVCMFAGELGKIAFNASYLMEILRRFLPGTVQIDLTNPHAAGMFRPHNEEQWKVRYLLMPMFVEW